MRNLFIVVASFAVTAACATVASAATLDWTNTLGGGFSTASNWSPAAVPGSADTTRFSLPNTYTVTFTSSPFVNTLNQTQGDVTLNLSTRALQYSNTLNNSLGAAGLTSTLRITNGVFRPGNLSVAGVIGSTSNLYLDTLSSTTTGSGAFYIGSAGTGNLWVQNGATLATSSGTGLGINTGAIGTATVLGSGSNWTITGTSLRVGSLGTGTLNILGGGSVVASGLEVGENLGSTGTVSLSGNLASFTTAGTANIGGTLAAFPAASATLNIGTGSTMSLNGTTNLRTNAKVNVSGGTLNVNTLNITSGALINWTAGTVNFATAPSITTNMLDALLASTHVLGSGRTLSATAGTLTLSSPLSLTGGKISVPTLDLNANLDIGAFSAVTASSTVTIETGATVRLSDFGTLGATGSIINNGGTLQLGGALANVTGAMTNTAGYIQGTGRFTAGLNNGLGGTIRAQTGDDIIIDTVAPTNLGTIELSGGTVEYSKTLTNSAGGTISGRGIFRGSASAPGGSGLANSGVLSFGAGITDIYGDVNNAVGGQVVAAGASTVTFYDDVVNNGDIRTVLDSRTVFFGSVSGAGTFSGSGTTEFEGDLKPGNSPANVKFGGNVVIGATAGTDIELAGTTKGSLYDSLTIAGSVSLGGDLNVLLIDGFKPSAGQSFNILSAAGGINGTFDSINLPSLAGGLFLDVAYSPTAIMLSIAGMIGDYNHSGDIDAADYIIWRKTVNSSGSALAADGDGNGVINANDFSIWRSNFGAHAGVATGTSFAAAVPEPTSLVLLFIAAAAFISRRRHAGL